MPRVPRRWGQADVGIEVQNIGTPDHRTILAHDFALINALQVEPTARADFGAMPVVPSRFEHQAHLFPVLVELRKLPDDQRVGLLDRMETWRQSRGTPYFSALLTCDDDAATLLRHLIHRIDVRLSDGSRDVLRLHDPRVFRHLPWILRPEQLSALLGNIQRWSWPGADATWSTMVHGAASPARRLYRFQIDATQWPSVLRIADTNAVLATLQCVAPELERNVKLAPVIDAQLAEAERDFPGAAPADRRLYAEHRVHFGAQLYRRPEMQSRMARVTAGTQGYFAACAGLDDETLAAWAESTQLAKECA